LLSGGLVRAKIHRLAFTSLLPFRLVVACVFLQKFELAMAGLNRLIIDVEAELGGDVASSLCKKFFGQNWLNLSKFDWIWEKIGKN